MDNIIDDLLTKTKVDSPEESVKSKDTKEPSVNVIDELLASAPEETTVTPEDTAPETPRGNIIDELLSTDEPEAIQPADFTGMAEGLRKSEEIGATPEGIDRLKEIIGVQLYDPEVGLGRKPRLLAEAIGGDVPGLGEHLDSIDPVTGRKLEPESRAEELLLGGGRFARDVYLFRKLRGIATGVSKIGAIAKAGKLVQSIPKVGSMLAEEIIPLAFTGAMFGGITADSNEPKEILAESAKSAMFLAAIHPALKGVQKVGTPIVRGAMNLFNKIFKKPIEAFNASNIKKLITSNVAGTQEALLERAAFTKKLRTVLSPKERELMPFIIQGNEVPIGLGRPDLQALMKNPTVRRKLGRMAKVVEKQYDAAHKFFIDSGGTMNKIDNYVTQLWDVPATDKSKVINFFRTNSSFQQGKFYESYVEGIKQGLVPRTLDIAKIMDYYDNQVFKAAFNIRFIDALKSLKDIHGKKLILPTSEAPKDYIKHTSRLFDGLRIHPEVAKFVDVLIDSTSAGQVGRAYDAVNALLKSTQLALSLFHPVALTEAAIVFPGVGLKEVGKLWNPKNIIRAARSGKFGIWKDVEGSKLAVRSGLGIHAPSDVQVSRVDKLLENFSLATGRKLGKFAGKVARLPLWLKKKQDWFLWEYLHPTYKLTAYHKGVGEALVRNPKIPEHLVRRSVAQFVNDTFGGQMFENLLISKNFARNMQRIMLSPDWNISTTRQAMAIFGVGEVNAVTGGIRKKLAEEFWKNTLIYFYAGAQMLNYRMTEAVQGQGRYMWDNPPGRKTHVFWGQAGKGPEKYIRPGKQFREVPEFITKGPAKFISKSSPLLRTTISSIDILTDPRLTYGEKNWEVVKEATGAFTPFGVSGVQRADSPTGLLVSVSDGMTPFSTRRFIERARVSGDDKGLIDIRSHALRNNINFDKQFKLAKAEITKKLKAPFKQQAREIGEEFFKLTGKEAEEFLVNLVASGRLLPGVEAELHKILKNKLDALRQKNEQ